MRLASLLLFLLSYTLAAPPSSKSPDDVIKQITKNISAYCTAPPPQRVASDHGFYVSDDINAPQRETIKITNDILLDFLKALMNMELEGKIRRFFTAFSMTPVGANLAVTIVSSVMSLIVIIATLYYCIAYRRYLVRKKFNPNDAKTETKTDKSTPNPECPDVTGTATPSTGASVEGKSEKKMSKESRESANKNSKETSEKKLKGSAETRDPIPADTPSNAKSAENSRKDAGTDKPSATPLESQTEEDLFRNEVSARPAVTKRLYKLDKEIATEAGKDVEWKLKQINIFRWPLFVLCMLSLVGSSVLFGASTMTYHDTEATRVDLVQEQVNSLETELAKIACQSSPSNLAKNFENVKASIDNTVNTIMRDQRLEVSKTYPIVAHTSVKNETESPLQSLSSLLILISAQISPTDTVTIDKLNAMKTRIDGVKTSLETDWDIYGPNNETLTDIVHLETKKEKANIQRKLNSGISSLKNIKFIQKKILENMKTILNKEYFTKAVHESGLYGNPFWTYLTIPLLFIFALLAIQSFFPCHHNMSLVYFSAAILSSLGVICSGFALNQSIGGLQNACHYLENEMTLVGNASVWLAASKWDGFKTLDISMISQCEGKKTYGEVFEKAIQYAINKEFDGIIKTSVNDVSFSNQYVNKISAVEADLKGRNADIGAGIDYLLALNKACSDTATPCGLDPADIQFSDPTDNGGKASFHFYTAAVRKELKAITAAVPKNPFSGAIAPIETLKDINTLKTQLKPNVKSALKRTQNEVENLLKSKMNAKCHLTTIYKNIVRRACDPIMNTSNALINVNYVVAFGFPLCGALLLLVACKLTFTHLLASLNKRKGRLETKMCEADETRMAQALPDEGDSQPVEGAVPMDFADDRCINNKWSASWY